MMMLNRPALLQTSDRFRILFSLAMNNRAVIDNLAELFEGDV